MIFRNIGLKAVTTFGPYLNSGGTLDLGKGKARMMIRNITIVSIESK